MGIWDALTGKTYRRNTLAWDHVTTVFQRVGHLPVPDFRRAVVTSSVGASYLVMVWALFDAPDEVSPFRRSIHALRPEQTYRSMTTIAQYFVCNLVQVPDFPAKMRKIKLKKADLIQFVNDSYGWDDDDAEFFTEYCRLREAEDDRWPMRFSQRVAEVAGLPGRDATWFMTLPSVCSSAYGRFMEMLSNPQ